MSDKELAKWFWGLIQEAKSEVQRQRKVDSDWEDHVLCPECGEEFLNVLPLDLIEADDYKSNSQVILELEKKFLQKVEFRSLVDL